MTATLAPLLDSGQWVDMEVGSDEWLAVISASKVAAILGVSPYDSPRSLWHKMRGDVPREVQTKAQSRGHYLEPAILNWWFDQHPEYRRQEYDGSGTFVRGWMAATPDALAWGPNKECIPVQAKSDAGTLGWGPPGSDMTPMYITAQVMWEMHVLGAKLCYVPMISAYLEFHEYVVNYDADLASAIEAKCSAFRHSLTGDTPPSVDSHPATYDVLRKSSPNIEAYSIDLTRDEAAAYVRAVQAAKAADAALLLAKSTVAERMGLAKEAKHGGQLVARRQNHKSGPTLYAARTLPEFGDDQTP